MENLWTRAHKFILDSKVGDNYFTGEKTISVIKRTPKKIYFSNGNIITIKKSQHGFYHLVGKNVNNILRDIEGYFLFLKHDPLLLIYPLNSKKNFWKIFGNFIFLSL